jgi:hypothetical protein
LRSKDRKSCCCSWGKKIAKHIKTIVYHPLPRYKHKRNHDETGMLLYAGECFVLEVCGAKSVYDDDDDDEPIV